MKKHLIFLITLFAAALFSISAAADSFTQSELDDYNNIYYPQSIYNGGINAAPQTSIQEAGVDPATGSVNVKVTDVSLPGVNGFDLNVTRMYNSSNAALFDAYLEEIDNPMNVTYYAIVGKKYITKELRNGHTRYELHNDIGLSPDVLTYLNTKDDVWLVKNSSEYEYIYSSNPSKKYLFDNLEEAQLVVNKLNSEANEINVEYKYGEYIYDDVLNYRVNYYDFIVVPVTKTESYTTYSNGLLDYTSNDKYSRIGTGWEFTFPYIEIRYGYDKIYRYLHFGEKGTWLMDFDKGGNNLDGYPLNDIKIVNDSSVTHDGISSWYRVDEKNGTKHYFAEDGRLLIQQDRYGNQIKFYCDTQNFTSLWGIREPHPYIEKIVDTMGREVVFTYENNASDPTERYVYITITDPADAGNKKTYVYVLFKLDSDEIGILNYDASSELDGDEWILRSVKDPTGYQCTYTYNYLTTKFSFLDRNEDFYTDYYDSPDSTKGNSYFDSDDMTRFDGVYNRYALLKKAEGYNSTTRSFEYAPFVKNCTVNGSMIFYKAYQSHENSAYSYDGDRYNTNKKTYTYDINRVGEYDGYLTYGFNDEILPSYTYAVKVTDDNVSAGKTSYDIYSYSYGGAYRDKTILLNMHNDYGTNHRIVTNYTYDNDTKLVTNVSSVNYSASDSTKYMTTSTAYTYDAGSYGDMLIQTPNGNTDRAVIYTYDSTYHFPLSKTYKRDSATSVREEYTPTADGKSIEFINIYENHVLKAKTQYAHDSYGNIINEKNYIDDEKYVEKQYAYQNGAFVTAETVKNVTDNDNATKDITTYASYDYWGNPLSVTDANGNTTSYTYNLSGDILSVTNPDGSQKTYEHETCYDYQCVWETDELGNRVKTDYQYARNPSAIVYSSISMDYKYFYYDPFGNLETEVMFCDDLDENGVWNIEFNKTRYTYDTLQRPISKKIYDGSDALLYNEQYSYDVRSGYTKETVTVEGSPSVVTSTYYDRYGNKIQTEVGDSVEIYTSDYAGNITSVKSSNANANGWSEVHTTEYDYMGNVIKETDELGNTTRAEYDSLGRMIKSYDQNNYASEYKYDNMGRLIEQKTPFEEKDGTVYYSVKKMWYDDNGNVVKEQILTNASGGEESFSEVKYTYDNRNRLAMTETNDGEKSNYTQYYYDAKGNILRTYTGLSSPLTINGLDDVTEGADSDYAVTKYTYDKFGRLISTTDALGQTESHTYDVVTGLLQTTTDRRGQTFNFSYDGLGNLTSKALADGTNAETTTYGLTGQVLSKQNGNSTISYVYNNKGQLVAESDTATGATKAYTYDANGNRTGFTLTRNGTAEISQTYAYDKLNRLVSVSENGTVIATYSYDNKGNRVQTVSNGITTEYAYNIANMLTSQISGNKLNESYTYYLNGNQKSKTVNGETTNYVYDKMNRLARENDTVYTFDDFGNRQTKTEGEATTSYTYDLNNRLTESNEVSDDLEINTRYFYDANGNQITKATLSTVAYDGTGSGHTISENTNEDIAIYEYNCYNQLIGVDTNGVVSSYTYLPDGMRFSKTVGGNTTTFVYDNANVIEEITTDGVNKYYRGIEIIKNDDNLYYLYNGQGDVAILTDNVSNTVASYIFDAYGNQSEENTIYNPFSYRGEYTDIETGLIYLRNRYYDPSIGRFITEDPARDGLNWYVYCENNPIMFVDPLGLYYVIENKSTCLCMDARCRNFGNPTGTYSVYADNGVTAMARIIVGEFVPYGGIINYSVEKVIGVVGGNSHGKLWDSVKSVGVNALVNSKNQRISTVGKVLNAKGVIESIINSNDIVTLDSIAFELMKNNNISMKFSSKEVANKKMEEMYSFILSNSLYFSLKIDGVNTLYEIDSSISKSKDPYKTINWFTYTYEQNLRDNTICNYTDAASTYKNFLRDYEERQSEVNNAVKSL